MDSNRKLFDELIRVADKTAEMCQHPMEKELLGLGLSKGQAEVLFECLRTLRRDSTLKLFLRSVAAMTLENVLVLLDGLDGDAAAPARLTSDDGDLIGEDLHTGFVGHLLERGVYR